MRRALVLVLASVFALLVLSPAASSVGAPLRDIKFELHEDGFLVTVKSQAGEEKVELSLYRHGEVAVYETAAKLTDDTVKARFGQLGELDYTFTPSQRAGPCSGFAQGTFEGTFEFTGENEYVTFEADRAKGTFLGSPKQGCREGRAAGNRTERGAEPEAWLAAHTRLPLPARSLLVFELVEKGSPPVYFNAFLEEKVEGMLVARGAQVSGPRRDFTWNLKAGTAHIDPPAPFTGSATFERRRGGRSVWRGSLTAPVLGGPPMRLTGADFRAKLAEGSPLD